MDIVLGVSMAPTSVRMLLVEGENADGVTVEDNKFDIATDDDAATLSAADQVISAILGTREGATEAGHALTSTGVTWTDPVDAAALHEALATRKIENVMLVSAFMAAAALAQTVGNTVGDHHTALLFLEPDTATLAVVDSADGAISDVHKELIPGDSVAELAGMLAGLDELETSPQSVFIVGTGVDVAAIKPQLETLTALPVTAAEEPETALAWGAALASANAPLFASSTAALAYAQDPGTGAVDPFAVSPGYLAAPDVPFGTELGEEDLAYSAVPDEEAEVHTVAQDVVSEEHLDHEPERRPLVLVGSILAVVFVAAALSLEVALALGIRPSVALLPRPLQNLIIQAPAPAAAPANVQVPEANHLIAPAIAPAPAHAPIPAPRPAAPALVPAAPPIPYRGSCAGGCSAPATDSGACAVAGPRRSAARAGPRPVSAARSPAAAGAPPVAAATGRRTGTASDSFARSRCRSRASRVCRGTCRLRGRGRTVPTAGTPALVVDLVGSAVRLAGSVVGTRALAVALAVAPVDLVGSAVRLAGLVVGTRALAVAPVGSAVRLAGLAVGTRALAVAPVDLVGSAVRLVGSAAGILGSVVGTRALVVAAPASAVAPVGSAGARAGLTVASAAAMASAAVVLVGAASVAVVLAAADTASAAAVTAAGTTSPTAQRAAR